MLLSIVTLQTPKIPIIKILKVWEFSNLISALSFVLFLVLYIHCRSLYVNMVGLWITVSLAMFSGLTMYSIYKDCDPLTNKDVGSADQVKLFK